MEGPVIGLQEERMVEIKKSFTVPPLTQRFGRCGNNKNDIILENDGVQRRRGESSPASHIGGGYRGSVPQVPSPSFRYGHGRDCIVVTGTTANHSLRRERVKSFVHGIVSPFTACWKPLHNSCVSGCSVTYNEKVYAKQPAVVSPLNSNRPSRLIDQDGYSFSSPSRYLPHPHHHQQHPNNDEGPNFQKQHYSYVSNPSSPAKELQEDCESTKCVARSPKVAPTLSIAEGKQQQSSVKSDIEQPRPDDILCGRGGSSNRHSGNVRFRELVAANKKMYVGLTKKQKMLVARKIVDAVHGTGGRFIAKDFDTGSFYDIGLPRSLEKTSQALREKNSNEMPAHLLENEGVETSIESFRSIVSNKDGKQITGESLDETFPSKSSIQGKKSKKTVDIPPLIIPQHLMPVFGTKKKAAPAYNKGPQHFHAPDTMSPRSNINTDQLPASQQQYHHQHNISPYTRSPSYSSQSPSPFYRNSYTHTWQPPIHPHQTHYYRASYPPSLEVHLNSGHYYCHQALPSYGRCNSVYEKRYGHHQDFYQQEYVSDHHLHNTDYEPARAIMRRYPPTLYHHPSTAFRREPSMPLSSSMQTYKKKQACIGENGSPLPNVNRRGGNSSTPRVIYRTPSNAYVRSNFDISPERQRKLKRQRNVDNHRVADASLSSAVSNFLTLHERCVGRERTIDNSFKANFDLVFPSALLQSRSNRREHLIADEGSRLSPSEKKEDSGVSTLSGLGGLHGLAEVAFRMNTKSSNP